MKRDRGILRLGNVRLAPNNDGLTDREDTSIPLRPQSFEVLRLLAARNGEVVSKNELMEAVWPGLAVTDDSLTQCIADIRRAIGDDKRKILQTVPKKGYRLVAQPDVVPPFVTSKRWPFAAGVVLAIVAAGLGFWTFNRKEVPRDPVATAPVVQVVTRSEPSIAVLPFESIDGGENWVRLGRGLAADIANELARNEGLYVTLPESLMNVALGDLPPLPDLNVRFYLGGTIQAQGEKIRISTHLTDATTAKTLWSETWTEAKDDIFAVQDQIIARIGGTLASTFSGVFAREQLRLAKRKLTDSLDAYEHYLIGFQLFHTFDSEDRLVAIDHLEAALDLDPEFAGAMVTLSIAQKLQADATTGETSAAWMATSQELAYRGYATDPNNPNVLWRAALAYALDGQMEIGKQLLRRSVEIAPNNADVLMISAGYAADMGIVGDEPLAWAARAFELNPLAPGWWYRASGSVAFAAGEYEKTIEVFRKVPLDWESWFYIALSEALLGNSSEAQLAAQKFRQLAPNMSVEKFIAGTEETRPDQFNMFEGARLAGLPISSEDL